MSQIATNKLRFLAQVRKSYPQLYRDAMKRVATPTKGLSGLGITQDEMLAEQNEGLITGANETPWYQSVLNSAIDTIKQLAPAYVATKQAKTCIDINARAPSKDWPRLIAPMRA